LLIARILIARHDAFWQLYQYFQECELGLHEKLQGTHFGLRRLFHLSSNLHVRWQGIFPLWSGNFLFQASQFNTFPANLAHEWACFVVPVSQVWHRMDKGIVGAQEFCRLRTYSARLRPPVAVIVLQENRDVVIRIRAMISTCAAAIEDHSVQLRPIQGGYCRFEILQHRVGGGFRGRGDRLWRHHPWIMPRRAAPVENRLILHLSRTIRRYSLQPSCLELVPHGSGADASFDLRA
jgi:hypothetical protein